MNKPLNSTGSALLSALFIMTLVAIAATAVATHLQLSIYRTQLMIHSDKSYLASQLVTFWNMNYLTQAKLNYSHALVVQFPKKFATVYPSVKLTGQLYDLQAKFNLNNLNDPAYRIIFYRLLKAFIANHSQRVQLTLSTLSWIKNYQTGQSNLDLADYYAKQIPPYFESQQPMVSLSEWRLVKGVSPRVYQALSPFLTVLPETTPINLRSVSNILLGALASNPNETLMHTLLLKRQEDEDRLKKLVPLINQLGISEETVSFESQYFLSIGTATMADFNLTTYAILKRVKDNQGKIKVFLVSEFLNGL